MATDVRVQAIHTVEGALISDVVYEQDAHGTAVVGRGYRPEALLAGSVPLCVSG